MTALRCAALLVLVVVLPRQAGLADVERIEPALVWEVDVAGAESDAMLSPVFASRDGKVIVAGLRGEVDGQEKSWTVFLDGETGRTVATLGLDDGASHYRPEGITPDGRYAVVRRSGAEVERDLHQIIDGADGEVVGEYKGRFVMITPGNRILGAVQGGYCLIDPATLEHGPSFNLPEWHRAAAIDNGESRLATRESNRKREVSVFDLQTGEAIVRFEAKTPGRLNDLAFVDQNTLRGLTARGRVVTWRLPSGEPESTVEPQDQLLHQGRLSEDGRYVIVHGWQRWDAETLSKREIMAVRFPGAAHVAVRQLDEGWALLQTNRRSRLRKVRFPKDPWVLMDPRGTPKVELAPEAEPAAPPPAVDAAALADPAWWVHQAKAEIEQIEQPELRARVSRSLPRVAGEAGLIELALEQLEAARSDKPLPGLLGSTQVGQTLVAVVTQLTAAGKDGEAAALVDRYKMDRHDRVRVEEAIIRVQVQRGRLEEALDSAAKWPDAAEEARPVLARALVEAGRVEEAMALAKATSHPVSRLEVVAAIGAAKAAKGDAFGVQRLARDFDAERHRDFWTQAVKSSLAADRLGTAKLIGGMPSDEMTRDTALQTVGLWLAERNRMEEAQAILGMMDRSDGELATAVALHHARNGDFEAAMAAMGGSVQRRVIDLLHNAGEMETARGLWQARLAEMRPASASRSSPLPPGHITALADAGHLDEALQYYRNLPGERRSVRDQAALAAAALRTGRMELFKEIRAPLAEKWDPMAGAPTRMEAGGELLGFDMVTGNVGGVQEIVPHLPPRMRKVIPMQLDMAVSGGMLIERGRCDIQRALLSLAATLPASIMEERDRLAGDYGYREAAATHYLMDQVDEWYRWAARLPEPSLRAKAYLSMAGAMVSSDLEAWFPPGGGPLRGR